MDNWEERFPPRKSQASGFLWASVTPLKGRGQGRLSRGPKSLVPGTLVSSVPRARRHPVLWLGALDNADGGGVVSRVNRA